MLSGCWELSRGFQGSRGVLKLCFLLVRTQSAKHWQPCSSGPRFPLSWCFGTRAVPGMVGIPRGACGGQCCLMKTLSSRCNAVRLDPLGFPRLCSRDLRSCLCQAPDFTHPGSWQRRKGWGGGDVLAGLKPTTFVVGLISLGEARLVQHRPVLGKVPWR